MTTCRVDVGAPAAITSFAQAAIAAHPSFNILINNAGVALLDQFGEIDQSQTDWLININFWGIVHSTRAFLPHLSARREAHIVNLSSIFGIVAPPRQAAYATANSQCAAFRRARGHELAKAKSPVRLSLVRGVATNIMPNSQSGSDITDTLAAVRQRDENHAAGGGAAHPRRHRENEPRILIGSAAASWTCCCASAPQPIGP